MALVKCRSISKCIISQLEEIVFMVTNDSHSKMTLRTRKLSSHLPGAGNLRMLSRKLKDQPSQCLQKCLDWVFEKDS